MNIFMLCKNPTAAAQFHNDKHTVKMLLEYPQILSTAHFLCDGPNTLFYKPTHKGHPSVKWAAASVHNYRWLWYLWHDLHEEYRFRYGANKTHKAWADLGATLKTPPKNISSLEVPMTREYQAVGDMKQDDPVAAYRDYYIKTKQVTSAGKPMAIWSRRGTPEWFITPCSSS